ncbi:hypothetical protein GOBAR_AA14833 [Gossypium barbadense]|uniref:Endonuclease/exonuclease/phosphatase domain-containing protein n=1 Tax=Gossypium barbadense TaxID=3634 RepID=A0A2P5XR90_GOSBA|nr:hypothetical protein GOBAR_AA14833 [Gossypium barbadense]
MGRVIRKTREDICFLQEIKLESVSIESVRKLWGDNSFDFKVSPAMEKSGGLLSIWDKNSFVRDSGMCEQRFIVVAGKWALEGMEAVLINIYAPNSSTDQRILWDEIIGLRNQFNSAWIIGGDFNDLQQQGLNRSISDHIPIFLCNDSIDLGPRPFKFINAWFKKKDCMCLIEKEWSGLRCFKRKMALKLRKLKGILKKWNVEDGNILEKRIIESESRIKEMDEISKKRELTVKELKELKHLNTEMWDAIRFKESIWRQKSRMT